VYSRENARAQSRWGAQMHLGDTRRESMGLGSSRARLPLFSLVGGSYGSAVVRIRATTTGRPQRPEESLPLSLYLSRALERVRERIERESGPDAER